MLGKDQSKLHKVSVNQLGFIYSKCYNAQNEINEVISDQLDT